MTLLISISIIRTDLSKLNYLTMCIKEAIRLHSVVPFIMRELKEDIVIDGKLVPKGLTVSIPIYSLHHNPLVWENSMVKYIHHPPLSCWICLGSIKFIYIFYYFMIHVLRWRRLRSLDISVGKAKVGLSCKTSVWKYCIKLCVHCIWGFAETSENLC